MSATIELKIIQHHKRVLKPKSWDIMYNLITSMDTKENRRIWKENERQFFFIYKAFQFLWFHLDICFVYKIIQSLLNFSFDFGKNSQNVLARSRMDPTPISYRHGWDTGT